MPCLEIQHADGIRVVAVYFLEHVPENLDLTGNDMTVKVSCYEQEAALKCESTPSASEACPTKLLVTTKIRAEMPALLVYASASSQRCLSAAALSIASATGMALQLLQTLVNLSGVVCIFSKLQYCTR